MYVKLTTASEWNCRSARRWRAHAQLNHHWSWWEERETTAGVSESSQSPLSSTRRRERARQWRSNFPWRSNGHPRRSTARQCPTNVLHVLENEAPPDSPVKGNWWSLKSMLPIESLVDPLWQNVSKNASAPTSLCIAYITHSKTKKRQLLGPTRPRTPRNGPANVRSWQGDPPTIIHLQSGNICTSSLSNRQLWLITTWTSFREHRRSFNSVASSFIRPITTLSTDQVSEGEVTFSKNSRNRWIPKLLPEDRHDCGDSIE